MAQQLPSVPTPADPWTLPDPAGGLPEVEALRLVVATSWRDVVPVRTALSAYARMIPVDAPAALVVTVPSAVTPADTEGLRVVLDHAALGHDTAPVELESFAETARRPAVAALVPAGDVHVFISELGEFLVALHAVADLVRDPHALASARLPRAGVKRGLAERLAEFAELPAIA